MNKILNCNLFFCFLICFSCEQGALKIEDEDEIFIKDFFKEEFEVSNKVKGLIDEGKKFLENGEPFFALQSFETALLIEPENIDAIFGSSLSEFIYASELFMMITTLVTQFESYGMGKKIVENTPATENEYIAKEFHYIFMKIREKFYSATKKLEKIQGKKLSFNVEKVPVYFRLKPSLIFRGEFDEGDVYLMSGIGNFLTGVFDFIVGQDLRTDLLTVVSIIKDGLEGIKFDFKFISNLFAYLLREDERFLNLHPGEGKFLFFESQKHFAKTGELLLLAFEWMKLMDNVENEVSSIETLDDGTLKLIIRNGVQDEENILNEIPLIFDISPSLQSALSKTSKNILEGKDIISLHEGIIPILSMIISTAFKVKMIQSFNIKFPFDMGKLSIENLNFILKTIIPDLLGFNWGNFFKNPVGFRNFLPSLKEKEGIMEGSFLCEWECPDGMGVDGFPTGWKRLLCPDNVQLKDSSHFENTPFEIPEDDIACSSPVSAFLDPSFNGLLYVRENEKDDFDVPTLKTLNLILCKSLINLFDLIKNLK